MDRREPARRARPPPRRHQPSAPASTTEGSATVDAGPATAHTAPWRASPPRRAVGHGHRANRDPRRHACRRRPEILGFDLLGTAVVSPASPPARDRLQRVLLICTSPCAGWPSSVVASAFCVAAVVPPVVVAPVRLLRQRPLTLLRPSLTAGTARRPGRRPVRKAASPARCTAHTAVVKLDVQAARRGRRPHRRRSPGAAVSFSPSGGGALTLTTFRATPRGPSS